MVVMAAVFLEILVRKPMALAKLELVVVQAEQPIQPEVMDLALEQTQTQLIQIPILLVVLVPVHQVLAAVEPVVLVAIRDMLELVRAAAVVVPATHMPQQH